MFRTEGRLLFLVVVGLVLIQLAFVVVAYKAVTKGLYVSEAFYPLATVDLLALGAIGVALAVKR